MFRILSKESVRKALYAKSPFNLATPHDDNYRDRVDAYLEDELMDDVLDIVYDIQKTNLEHQKDDLYHQYHATQR